MALGIVGAGTNNARLAGILRNLASYYYKEPTLLFLVRTAQGLAHMGKGLIGLSPYHTDRQLLSGACCAERRGPGGGGARVRVGRVCVGRGFGKVVVGLQDRCAGGCREGVVYGADAIGHLDKCGLGFSHAAAVGVV